MLCLGVIGGAAALTGQPLLFPSLGPTIMLIVDSPNLPSAQPKNIASGHLVGIAAGWLALVATGLLHEPPVTEAGVSWLRRSTFVAAVPG